MSSLFEVSSTLAKLEDSVSKAVSHFTLEIVQPRVISFEDQVGSIRWVRYLTSTLAVDPDSVRIKKLAINADPDPANQFN